MSIKTEGIADYFKKLGDPVYTRRGIVKSLYSRYVTEDVLRLYSKLENPDFKGLMVRADDLMVREDISLYKPDTKDWTEEILTQMHYNVEVEEDDFNDSDRQTEYERRRDVTKWREAYSDVLSEYTYSRLDLAWDLAWSFYVTYRKGFRQGHLKVYASIMGEIPKGLDGVPFQNILTSERKLRQRRRKDRLAKAILSKDEDTLITLGLTKEEITKAFKRAEVIRRDNE